MGLSGSLYTATVVIIQTALFTLPYFQERIEGGSYLAILFTGAFLTGLLAIAWPGLKIVHFAALPILVFITEMVALSVMRGIEIVPTFPIENGADLADLVFGSGVIESTGIQIFISLVLIVGYRIRKSFNTFGFRRAALDLDEIEKIMRIDPGIEEKSDIFRYQRLMNRGYSVVGAAGNRIECAIHAVRKDDFLFLFDLRVSPETREEEAGRRIVRYMLSRPEIMESGIYVIAACDARESEEAALYRSCGFEPLPENDPLVQEIRERLRGIDERISIGSHYLSAKGGLLFYAPSEAA
jgi:ribosomal protein S18 acetylase RimI-like enzyme